MSWASASALDELDVLEELEAASCCREQGPMRLGHWRQTKLCIGQADGAIEVYGIERDVGASRERVDVEIGL